jgi:hypothetical protein
VVEVGVVGCGCGCGSRRCGGGGDGMVSRGGFYIGELRLTWSATRGRLTGIGE